MESSKSIWNAEETATFYAALEHIGTDFSLMEAIFFKDSTRDRKQLKQKFKREEKINRELIDGILYKQLGMAFTKVDIAKKEVESDHTNKSYNL